MVLRKFDPLFEHPLRADKELRAKIEKYLKKLTSLERHFRFALAYVKRGRAIKKDFNKTL